MSNNSAIIPTMLQMMVLALTCLLALVSSTTSEYQSYGYSSYFPHYSPLPFDQRSNPFLYPAATNPQSMVDEGSVQSRGFGVISIMLLSQITTRLLQLEEMVNNMSNTNGQGNTDELESLKLKLANLEGTVTDIISNVTLLEATVNVTTNEQAGMKLNLTLLETTVNVTTNEQFGMKLNLTLLETTINATANDLTAVQLNQMYLEGNLTVTKNEQAGMKLNMTILQENSTDLSTPTSIGGPPTSCQDLLKLGNTKSGIYNIKVAAKVAMVYCDFTKAVTDAALEKQIGYAEVKSQSVYFQVGLQNDVEGDGSYFQLRFDNLKLQVGNAFDLTSGTFTAPCDGTYLFSFTAAVEFREAFTGVAEMSVSLSGFGGPFGFVKTSAIAAGQVNQVHFDFIVSLYKSDPISVTLNAAKGIYLLASRTFFHGMLLQETSPASV